MNELMEILENEIKVSYLYQICQVSSGRKGYTCEAVEQQKHNIPLAFPYPKKNLKKVIYKGTNSYMNHSV